MFVSIPVIIVTPIIFVIITIATIITIDRDSRQFVDFYRTDRDQLKTSLDEKNRIIESLESQNFETDCKIIQLQSELEQLRNQLAPKDVQIEELQAESEKIINTYRTNLNDCHAMLDERDRAIERLESELQMYELVEREYISEIAHLNDTISELHKELCEKRKISHENLIYERMLEDQIEALQAENREYFDDWMAAMDRSHENFESWMAAMDENLELRSQIWELRAERDEYYNLVDEYTDPFTRGVITDDELPY